MTETEVALCPCGHHSCRTVESQALATLIEKAAAPHLAVRELNDGRRFDMVNVFYEAQELGARLEELGWVGSIPKR